MATDTGTETASPVEGDRDDEALGGDEEIADDGGFVRLGLPGSEPDEG